MPQSVYFVLLQYFAETTSLLFTHLRRTRLPDEAYDYLAMRTATGSRQHAAVLQVALRMMLVFHRREAAFQDVWGRRWDRQQDRAMQAIPTLLPHIPVTQRVRQLVREHQITTETLAALLREHPTLQSAAATFRQRAEANFEEDVSSTAGTDTDFEP